ncbi:hypothetical protein MYX64_06435 [Nitrospinae bacterium AH_259_B05_G02_I21]|nr:hypothetical protein [Nitrospinae bacterium AH_259_B05_G02_I21]
MSERMEQLLEELLREVRGQKGSTPAAPTPADVPHGVLIPYDHDAARHNWRDLEQGDFGHPTGFYLGRKKEDHHPLDPAEFVGELYDTAFNDLVPFVAMIVHVYSEVEANLVVWDHFGHQFHVVRGKRGDPDNIVREKKESGTAEELPDATVELYGISHVKRGDLAGWIPGRNIWYAPIQIGVA